MYFYFVIVFVFVFVFMDARLAKHKPPRPSETDCLLDSFLNLCSVPVQCVSSTTFHFTAVTNRCVTCICISGCVSVCSVNVFSPVFSVFVFRTKCYLRITRGWMELVSISSLVSASGSISQHWQARARFLRAKRRPRGNPSYLSGHLSDRCQHRKQ